MSGQGALLGDYLDYDEADVQSTHGFTNRLGINAIVLLALDVGLDEPGVEQHHWIAPAWSIRAQ